MSESYVQVDLSNPAVAVVTLDRPAKRNALSLQLMEELLSVVQTASEDVNRRVLLLRANGPAFCAGLDLKEAANRANTKSSARALAAVYKAIAACPLITVAAAQGAVFGGGVGLLSACDLVVAANDMQIGFPEVKRGLVAALVTALVRRQVNDRTLRELVLLGKTITATQALSMGLLNQVVPLDQLIPATEDLIAQAQQSAPVAVARTKKLLDALWVRPMAEELDRVLQYHLEARDSAEAIEGIAAFLEKREPHWPPRSGK